MAALVETASRSQSAIRLEMEKRMKKEVESKLAKRERLRARSARDLNRHFNKAFVLPSESAREYNALHKTLKSELPSVSVMDKYEVERIARSMFHVKRTWRLECAAIAAGRPAAVLKLMAGNFGSLGDSDRLVEKAMMLFIGSEEQREMADEILRQFGVTKDQLEAVSLEEKAEFISALGKMRDRSDAVIQSAYKRLLRSAKSRKSIVQHHTSDDSLPMNDNSAERKTVGRKRN